MNILLITTNIDRSESEMFARMHEMGHRVVAICDTEDYRLQRLQRSGMEIHNLRIGKRFNKDTIAKIRKLIDQYDFDIVHILRKYGISNFFHAIPRPRAKVIVYRGIIGNLSFFDPISWATFLNPKIDRIICVCEAIRQYFLDLRFLLYKLPREKFVTIHKGHDVAWYNHVDETSPVLEQIKTKQMIGCVARMRARKGVNYLIEAFDRIAGQFDVSLLLIGDAEDKKIIKRIAKSPYKDRILLTGFVKDATVIAGKLDVIVLPSLRREGLPRAIIEGMAQGVPAIVTHSGGSPEIIEDGKSGFVIPTHDSTALAEGISSLLSNEERRCQFSENARKRIVKHFNVDTTVEKTLSLYKELLAE